MGCQAAIADTVTGHGADFLFPLKSSHPTLEAEVARYFKTAPAAETTPATGVEKGHGRIETRIVTASSRVDWIVSERSFPGQTKFTSINTIIKVVRRTEFHDRCTLTAHFYISSAPKDAARLAEALRGHWAVESMHWILDVAFEDDLSRYRTGNGANNMAVIRRFALNLVRADKSKGSVKTKRKSASWDTSYRQESLNVNPR